MADRQNPVVRGNARAPVAKDKAAAMAAADSASAVARKKYYADQASKRSAAKSQPPKSMNPLTKLVSALKGK